jgi:hypothetical protein
MSSAAEVQASLDALTDDQFHKMINKQRTDAGSLIRFGQSMLLPIQHVSGPKGTREVMRKWIAADPTPCMAKLLTRPGETPAYLQFHTPAPNGMKCTFPNGLTKPAVIVPDTSTASTASTARGGKRRATRNMRNKRRATRRRR